MTAGAAENLVILVTTPPAEAERIARSVVQEGLAACVNILPAVRSIYSWKGEICDDGEALLVMKTRAALFETLRGRVVALHPYEVPEIIGLPIEKGHEPYLEWLVASTREP